MASTFKLEIVTPNRKFFDDDVELIVVRTIQGDIAVMHDHMHTISPLSTGVIKIQRNNKLTQAACAEGFIQVKDDKTTIITNSAEWPEEIDVERAKKAKERAEERLNNQADDIDVPRAKAAMLRALTRIRVKEEIK